MMDSPQKGSAEGASDEAALPTERLLRISDAARLLGIGRTTFYKLIQEGDIHVVHIGRAVRVPVAEVDAFVARLHTQATT